jgi:predicted Zn-dependent peptidase
MFKSPRLDPDDVARERTLALAEARRGAARGAGRIERELFAGFPYGLAAADEKSLQNATAEAVVQWHKGAVQYRKPIVVIVGDTQGTSLARYFVRTFSGSRYEDVKLPEGFPKPLEARRTVTERWGRSATALEIGFQAPPAGDDDSYALMVLESYLAGPGGRLADELEERQEVASAVAVEYRRRLRGGSFVITVAPIPGKDGRALELVEGEIKRLWETAILYKDYRAAVHRAVGGTTIAQQSHGAQIESLTRYVLEGKGVEEISNHTLRLEGVREDDLPAVARRVLKLDRAVIVRYAAGGAPLEADRKD